jgi:hypothetical protein
MGRSVVIYYIIVSHELYENWMPCQKISSEWANTNTKVLPTHIHTNMRVRTIACGSEPTSLLKEGWLVKKGQ